MKNLEQRLKTAVAEIEARDRELAQELDDLRPAATLRVDRQFVNEVATTGAPAGPQVIPSQLIAETIVLRTGRPVLAVVNDEPELVFRDAESEVWRNRLVTAKSRINTAVQAVGRVEVQHHPFFQWIGTGWLVRDDVIVTNRHVAQEFGRRQGTRFLFRQGTQGRPMKASIDFLEEFGRGEAREFSVLQVLHIEDDAGPDIALLRVERNEANRLASPITLAADPAIMHQQVAVIGYPARDSRIPDQQLMADIFGDVFDKKRLAPGQITRRANGLVLHDCSTLGGNSGSVVLDLESGSALGLHFAGRFLEANYAVPAEIVARRLEAVTRGESRSSTAVTRAAADRDDGGRRSADAQTAARQLTVTIPVRITVDVGAVADDTRPVVSAVASPTPAQDRELEDDELILTEGRPADYVDRAGYDADFLGDGNEVPLPNVIRDANDVLPFEVDGGTRTVLDYEHFSVVMSRRRKMCIFSAVNIDGTRPHRIKRTAWRTDPRIPADAQTVRGCYGNPPKFARGHMTRREDPIWGNRDDATRGNADSMHLTNAVPQMQPFNAGIWLGLEDYALQNAREDDMRVCVFTGPVFRGDDPRRFGVKIPVTFWKVIAFIHDETRELCATGYTMSQADFLREQEFVFGAHRTAQASLAVIEDLTGLSFGTLTAVDPLAGDVEEATPPPLTSFGQIRFTR